MKYLSLCTGLLLTSMTVTAQNSPAFKGKYPDTKTVNQQDDFFGTKVSDPYRWLENDMADDTKSWVKQENAVTDAYLEQIPFRENIKKRLALLWNYEKYSAP